jgi:hypothetical protein
LCESNILIYGITIFKSLFFVLLLGLVLGEPREGLLKFVHKYYPKKLEGALNCTVCVSGWLSMVALCALSPFYGLILLPLALLAPAVCFVITRALDRLIF